MKEFLPIGTYVKCSGKVKIDKNYTKRNILLVQCFVEGFIVGGSYLKEGTITHNYEEGDYFTPTKAIFAYRVIRGFINKPIFVLPEQIVYNHFPENPGTCPFIAQDQPPWSERDKLFLREEMKDWPRDERGRWIKKVAHSKKGG